MPILIQYNQNMIKKNDKLDVTEIKNFCFVKGNVKRIRRQATVWEKIFANDTSEKELIFKIYENTLKLSSKEMNNPIKK